MRKSIRPLIAMTAALALTVTAGMSALAQAEMCIRDRDEVE